MTPHEVFVDRVRCSLVIPRRNLRRALDALRAGDNVNVKHYLHETYRMIEALEEVVNAEDQRTICKCDKCGDSHYVKRGLPATAPEGFAIPERKKMK